MILPTRIFILLLSLLAMASVQAQELEITITGGTVRATPVAVVPFAGSGQLPVKVHEIIADNLSRSGLFSALPEADMLEKPTDPEKVEFRNWRTLGVEYVVVGEMRRGNSVRFHLIDVFRGQQLIAFDMPGVRDPEQLRYTAHDISDLIFKELTGHAGVFNTRIAYVTSTGSGQSMTFRLVVADADGYNPRSLVTSREPIMSPAWSPDGRRLAYVAYRQGRSAINVIDLESGSSREIVSERGINGSPAWSPDGSKLAVTLSFENNPDIYVIDLATGNRTRLTTHWGIDTEPSWSPDGNRIVFTSDRGGNPHIYEIPATGGDPRRLTFEGRQNLRATYSPDGEKLLIVHLAGSGYQIALMDLRSRDVQPLTRGPLDESPTFAPNGQMVIYATRGSRGAELATVTVDGRVRQSLRQSGEVREPAWSPHFRAQRN
jgi:TolB protein